MVRLNCFRLLQKSTRTRFKNQTADISEQSINGIQRMYREGVNVCGLSDFRYARLSWSSKKEDGVERK